MNGGPGWVRPRCCSWRSPPGCSPASRRPAAEAARHSGAITGHGGAAQTVSLLPMDAVTPSEGWGVLHLFYTIDRDRAAAEPGAAKRVLDAGAAPEPAGHPAPAPPRPGPKADLRPKALR